MRILFAAAALAAVHSLLDYTPAAAQPRWPRLTPAETRAYHACLSAAWIEDYCRGHSWGAGERYDRTFAACVWADGGRRYPVADRYGYSTEDYCWRRARGLLR